MTPFRVETIGLPERAARKLTLSSAPFGNLIPVISDKVAKRSVRQIN